MRRCFNDVANPATVDALLEHASHLIVHRMYVRAIWCIERQKLHGVTSSVSWSIVSEEISCYRTNRRQKVLTEQDVTVISTINFYTRLNEHQFGSSK